jgi:competence protein ComEA
MKEDMMTAIGSLIELDLAAVEAYRLAAGVCVDGDVKKQLTAFASDHERHVRDLSEWARAQGNEPPSQIGNVGKIIVGFTKISSQEERTAVLAMRGNEELTNGAYASALRAQAPDDLRAVLARGFEDERRHIAWIREAIRLRGWDQEPAELREVLKAA